MTAGGSDTGACLWVRGCARVGDGAQDGTGCARVGGLMEMKACVCAAAAVCEAASGEGYRAEVTAYGRPCRCVRSSVHLKKRTREVVCVISTAKRSSNRLHSWGRAFGYKGTLWQCIPSVMAIRQRACTTDFACTVWCGRWCVRLLSGACACLCVCVCVCVCVFACSSCACAPLQQHTGMPLAPMALPNRQDAAFRRNSCANAARPVSKSLKISGMSYSSTDLIFKPP